MALVLMIALDSIGIDVSFGGRRHLSDGIASTMYNWMSGPLIAHAVDMVSLRMLLLPSIC